MDFEGIWQRILQSEGEEFHQKGGNPFTYSVTGQVLRPSRTDWNLSKSLFKKAFERLPISGPGEINDLQGPSYLFTILTDPHISKPADTTEGQLKPRISPRALLEIEAALAEYQREVEKSGLAVITKQSYKEHPSS